MGQRKPGAAPLTPNDFIPWLRGPAVIDDVDAAVAAFDRMFK